MKRFLFFILLGQLVLCKAQTPVVFCPPGAEWHYLYYNWPFEYLNEHIKYTGDTVLNGETCKVLKHTRSYLDLNIGPAKTTFIKQNGDTVFMKSAITQNTWQILYNYAAQAGQSWQTAVNYIIFTSPTPSVTYTVTVDSVRVTTTNSFNLRTLYVRYTNGFSYANDTTTITERLGCAGFLFNYWNTNIGGGDGDRFSANLCYEDNVFGLLQYTQKACNYTNVGIEEYENTLGVSVYPNPVSNALHITAPAGLLNGVLSITDVCGRYVKQVPLKNMAEQAIDISDLQAGVYFIKVNDQGYLKKIIKN